MQKLIQQDKVLFQIVIPFFAPCKSNKESIVQPEIFGKINTER